MQEHGPTLNLDLNTSWTRRKQRFHLLLSSLLASPLLHHYHLSPLQLLFFPLMLAQLKYVGRPPLSATAIGVSSWHKKEAETLLKDAFNK